MASTVIHAPDPHLALPTDPLTPTDSVHDSEVPRGRLKRRRMSSHTPPRARSPSRGHDRESGSRHRQHYRKHQRASSSPFIGTPPVVPKNRRRSDAEPDHTFRGRGRLRSESRSRSPILEGEEKVRREVRKRSQPPSRRRVGEGEERGGNEENAVRRLRSYPNMYKQGRRQEGEEEDDVAVADEEDNVLDGT